MNFIYLNLSKQQCIRVLFTIVLLSWSLLKGLDVNAQTECSDPGGGFRFIHLGDDTPFRNFYPGTVPSGRSGVEKTTAGYVYMTSKKEHIYTSRAVTIIPELSNTKTGSVVIKFDILDTETPNTFISIYYGTDTSGIPDITINKDNVEAYVGTTLIYNGPVTIQFSKTTEEGEGNFYIFIKYLTGDQVITSCQNEQVAVWTDFMQPDSYTFIDDIGESYGGNSAPICVGYFNHKKQFVSSEVSFCLDHDKDVASVAWWFYPGEIVYTHNSNPNHDIDRSGIYDVEDQLKKARILWIVANEPMDSKAEQLAVQKAIWATLDSSTGETFTPGKIEWLAQQAVLSLPDPKEPDFSIVAGNLGTLGSPVNCKLNFDIENGHTPRVKLLVPAGLTIGTVTGNGTYDSLTGFVTFTSLPGSVDISVFSSVVQSAKITAVYEEENFWNINNLEVYNSCNPAVQDFIGLSRRDITYPYREAVGIWSSSLPMTLLNFDVYSEGNSAKLGWKTVVEENSEGFEIQRADDARVWETLGFVAAKSGGVHTTSQLNYSFVDTEPLDGVNYYRLKMVDLDGAFTYSPIRLLERDVRFMHVYPNPVADGKLIIDISDGNFYHAEVYNMAGVAVSSQNLGRSRELDVSQLVTGMYMLCIISANGDVKTSKFVIK